MKDCLPDPPLQIFIISRGIPSVDSPLNGIFEFDQAKALTALGHKVVFLAIDLRSIRHKRRFGYSRFVKEGVSVLTYDVPLGRIPKCVERFFGTRLAKRLHSIAVEEFGEPDIIHAHFAMQGLYAKAIRDGSSSAVVYTEHCSLVSSADRGYCTLMTEACEAADLCIAVSEPLATAMAAWTTKETTIIQNIADVELFSKPAKQPHSGIHFISTGSLIPRKNHGLLIEAFATARHLSKLDLRLTIIGEGVDRGALNKLIETLDIKNCVTLAGLYPREKIAEAYANADCFVLASAAETFGVVCIEAMAAGLPVIATQCGGPEAYVRPFCGMVIPANNKAELVDALLTMANNYAAYNSSVIREYAKTAFSDKTIASQLEAMYRLEKEKKRYTNDVEPEHQDC